jgi:hypothetical protein
MSKCTDSSFIRHTKRRDRINNGVLYIAATSNVMDIKVGLVCYKHMQILCIIVGKCGI